MSDLYYARGADVVKRPERSGNGENTIMGFTICTCGEEEHARYVAEALNRGRRPMLGNADLLMAMEWGLRAHEKGLNLEAAKADFYKLLAADNG
jgi:hypothetical protein